MQGKKGHEKIGTCNYKWFNYRSNWFQVKNISPRLILYFLYLQGLRDEENWQTTQNRGYMKINLKSNLTCNIYMQHNGKQSDSTTKSIMRGGNAVQYYWYWKTVSGFIQKIATIFQGLFRDFSRTTLDFQGQPIRNIISQIVQKCIFPVYSNKTLRL